ncbi:MAG: prepilin-type N-terminal cleavage/methylation domain-containing protein [Candidatus Omnitrophica bacterium]|nr:prepilin-type N-terminal cleavage/methylation domain-containing protein [Candidatus Omnitrophota bacterium]
MRYTQERGFTLIELLIVIAIILVLIAMALPNFLEAQLRARVTSAQGSMKSTATALEAYAVDWRGRYPWGAALENLSNPMLPPEEGFEAHLPAILTTPIAYMTELLPDPFTNLVVEGSDRELLAPFHYNEEKTLEALGEPAFLPALSLALYGQLRSGKYYIFSHGPDGDHDESLDRSEAGKETCRYSPTNGTKSNGDIYYFGPGVGFN